MGFIFIFAVFLRTPLLEHLAFGNFDWVCFQRHYVVIWYLLDFVYYLKLFEILLATEADLVLLHALLLDEVSH